MEKRKTNKKFEPDLKLEAVLEHRIFSRKQRRFGSVQQLCDHFGITASHLREWGGKFRRRGPEIFAHGSAVRRKEDASKVVEKQREYIARLEDKVQRLQSQLALESGPATDDRITRPPQIAP